MMYPVRYCLAKALTIRNGSLYATSGGLSSTSLQNVDHLSQCPLAAAAMFLEITSLMLSAAVRNILRKIVFLAGSTVAMTASVGRWNPCG